MENCHITILQADLEIILQKKWLTWQEIITKMLIPKECSKLSTRFSTAKIGRLWMSFVRPWFGFWNFESYGEAYDYLQAWPATFWIYVWYQDENSWRTYNVAVKSKPILTKCKLYINSTQKSFRKCSWHGFQIGLRSWPIKKLASSDNWKSFFGQECFSA